jgi:hypothetical protein
MNIKIKKVTWLILILLIVSGASVGYYFFNKGPRDVKSSRGTKITATELYAAFTTDTVAAYKNYSDKILEIAGIVEAVSDNSDHIRVITIKTDLDGAFINCTMEENNQNVEPGVMVNIKGICSGIGEGEPDLGIKGDVYLSRCYLMK